MVARVRQRNAIASTSARATSGCIPTLGRGGSTVVLRGVLRDVRRSGSGRDVIVGLGWDGMWEAGVGWSGVG